MPAAILTQDLVAICLLLTRGKTDVSLQEAAHKIEAFQEMNNRHFGISRSDVPVLFMNLVKFELRLEKNLDETQLAEVIPDMLKYHDAYFNDEGSHWIFPGVNHGGIGDIKLYLQYNRWYGGYPRFVLKARIEGKRVLFDFFTQKGFRTPKSVMNLLTSLNYGYDLLFHCSSGGEWS